MKQCSVASFVSFEQARRRCSVVAANTKRREARMRVLWVSVVFAVAASFSPSVSPSLCRTIVGRDSSALVGFCLAFRHCCSCLVAAHT